MDFEEREQAKRKRLIRVVVAEAGMVLAVVVIVGVAILAAMGFFVSSNGTIEQSGLIQIHSVPTGGTVELDGATLFSRTNLSRTMSAGEHEIKISRDNYDSWEKTVKMYSGMLLRLYYPRLFLLNRTTEDVLSIQEKLMFYSVSNDKTSILYASQDSVEWTLLDIKNDDVRTTRLDLSNILPNVEERKFLGGVEIVEWSKDSDNVLIRTKSDEKREWLLVNLKDVNKSLNLTKTFGLEFERVEMVDGSSAQMFALENRHLRKINTSNQAISRVLLDDVLEFDNDGTDVIYVAEKKVDDAKEKIVGVYRDGEKDGTILAKLSADRAIKVALTRYYDAYYLTFVVDNKMNVKYGTLPSYREGGSEMGENSDLKELVSNLELSAIPQKLSVSSDGEYVVARQDDEYMVLDLDMGDLYEYAAGVRTLKWLGDGMMYGVLDGSLSVWDFDHTNRRTLVALENDEGEGANDAVTTVSKFPVRDYDVVIANNNKWLYYVVQTDESLQLRREKVRD